MNRGEQLTHIGYRLIELKGAEGKWSPEERIAVLERNHVRMAKDLRLVRGTALAATVAGNRVHRISGVTPTDFGLAGRFLGVSEPGLIYDDGTQDAILKMTSLDRLYDLNANWRYEAGAAPRYFYSTEGGLIICASVRCSPPT